MEELTRSDRIRYLLEYKRTFQHATYELYILTALVLFLWYGVQNYIVSIMVLLILLIDNLHPNSEGNSRIQINKELNKELGLK